ncbi:MAG: UDP-2,3-diacylglucosamine diphosphatase [Rikenellaceae bacterium]
MYYFVSDVHLGSAVFGDPREVERRFVAWLKSVETTAQTIFLCGDIFDFWFEYKRVVPKGFVRVLAQLAHLHDLGVRVVFMAGNHDMWIGDYLSLECGVELYTRPHIFEVAGRRVHVAHGDNLNVGGDLTLRLMNGLFRSSAVRSLFSCLIHPDLAMKFGQWWSGSSRKGHVDVVPDYEAAVGRLVDWVGGQHVTAQCDYYLFGHLHTMRRESNSEQGYEVVFINDWMRGEPHCAVIDEGGELRVEKIEL